MRNFRSSYSGGRLIMFWITFLGTIMTVITALIAWKAFARRQLSVWFTGFERIDREVVKGEIEVAVLKNGEKVDGTIYRVLLNIKATGNRDISADIKSEYIEFVFPARANVIQTFYQKHDGRIDWSRSEENHHRLHFDLIKKKEELWFDFFLVVPQDMTKEKLIKETTASVRVKDVEAKYLNPDRYENIGQMVSTFGIFIIFGGAALLKRFWPVSNRHGFELADGTKIYFPGNAGDAGVRYCHLHGNPFEAPKCSFVSLEELQKITRMTADGQSLYFMGSGYFLVFVVIALLVGSYLFSGGGPLGKVVANKFEGLIRYIFQK